jgi:hypothetical protein
MQDMSCRFRNGLRVATVPDDIGHWQSAALKVEQAGHDDGAVRARRCHSPGGLLEMTFEI